MDNDQHCKEFLTELQKLLDKYEVEITADVDGDTHGVHDLEVCISPRLSATPKWEQSISVWCGETVNADSLKEML